MINLLPSSEKEKLRREYRLRLAVVVLIVLLVILFIANIAVVSSFIMSSVKLSVTKEQKEEIQNSESGKKRRELTRLAQEVNYQADFLHEGNKARSPSSAAQTILENLGEYITLSAILYKAEGGAVGDQEDEEAKKSATFQVRGVATNRTQLVEFRDRLQASSVFTNVVLPVSNLVSDENIEFTVELAVRPPEAKEI